MVYRSPLESMRRELTKLEDELAGLRALPDPVPQPLVRSKKARAKVERERRSLQSELAKLEHQIQKRSLELGLRELTPREQASSLRTHRVALVSSVLGVFVFCVHIVYAALARPAEVRLVERLSIGWLMTAGLLVAFGVLAFWLGALDRRKRQRGEIEADDFASEN